jgi:CheY-like chemotaxis protein
MAQAIPNILVVEDDRETRTLIAKYLRSNSCNVTTAADGREMVRAMTDRRVDLLILDVMLPGEDGLTLCSKVRAQAQTPIIMLTARGEDVDRILGLEMGADDYLASRSTRANCWRGSMRCCAGRRPPGTPAPSRAQPRLLLRAGGSTRGCASCAIPKARASR